MYLIYLNTFLRCGNIWSCQWLAPEHLGSCRDLLFPYFWWCRSSVSTGPWLWSRKQTQIWVPPPAAGSQTCHLMTWGGETRQFSYQILFPEYLRGCEVLTPWYKKLTRLTCIKYSSVILSLQAASQGPDTAVHHRRLSSSSSSSTL